MNDQLFSSPNLHPAKVDFASGLISFVPMTRATWRASSFLDHRTQAASPERFEIPIPDLLLTCAELPRPQRVVHYLFHAAFCCSTLLARYLDLIPPCFVLKEPLMLTEAAIVRPRAIEAHNDGTLTPDEWDRFLDLSIRLLNRRYAPEDIVVTKTNDLCNSLGEILLARDRASKAVFLTIGLKEFLLVLMKGPDRRRWLRARLRRAQQDAAIIPELAGFDPAAMTDAEGGAYLWALNEALRARLSAIDPGRVLTLPGERIADAPAEAVRAAAEHFGLPVSNGLPKNLFSGATATRHAKDPSRTYDARSRRKELNGLEKKIGREADRGVEWAMKNRVLFGGVIAAELTRTTGI
jgi:hypothetical protein